MWYVYILKLKDGSYYTGITTKLEDKVIQHSSGKGGSYTKGRLPCELAYWMQTHSQSSAQILRHEIKKMSHSDKKSLIESRVLIDKDFVNRLKALVEGVKIDMSKKLSDQED